MKVTEINEKLRRVQAQAEEQGKRLARLEEKMDEIYDDTDAAYAQKALDEAWAKLFGLYDEEAG